MNTRWVELHGAEKRERRLGLGGGGGTSTRQLGFFRFFNATPGEKTLSRFSHLRAAVPDVRERHGERTLGIRPRQPTLEDAVGQGHRGPLVQHLRGEKNGGRMSRPAAIHTHLAGVTIGVGFFRPFSVSD